MDHYLEKVEVAAFEGLKTAFSGFKSVAFGGSEETLIETQDKNELEMLSVGKNKDDFLKELTDKAQKERFEKFRDSFDEA